MPYTKQDLITLYSLQENEVNQTLTAAGLCVESEFYTDEQIQISFELIRSYFNSGQVSDYTAAAQLFEQHQDLGASEEQQPKNKKFTKGKKSEPFNDLGASLRDHLNVLQLIALASEHCLVKIELLEAVQIMPSCGLLPNQSEFTQDECDRFVEACDLIKKQNKTYDEVAAHFGLGSASKTNVVNSPQQLLELLADSTVVVDDNLMDLINKITAKQTDGVNLQKLVRQSYFMNLSRQMSENQDDTDTFFADLESRVMDYIEGKNRARSLGTTWEWATNSLPPSSPRPMSLPEDSNNGTSGN